MFWDSVLGGFATLLHWQVWLATAIYVALYWSWFWAIVGIQGGSEGSDSRRQAGKRIHNTIGPAFETLLLGGLVIYLTPLLLGRDKAMPLIFFASFAWLILKVCALALLVSLVLSWTPFIGSIIKKNFAFNACIQGLIIFRFTSSPFITVYLSKTNIKTSSLYPDFWQIVGYICLSLAVINVCFVVLAVFGLAVSRDHDSAFGAGFLLVGIAAPLIAGVLPVFMYANHVLGALRLALTSG